MQTHKKHLPNPAAFPACCLVVSEMDAAACFCDGAVVGELNARNATFFRDLQAFTPMACGFQVKTGDVCTDARALESFITEEAIELVGNVTEVATVEELISEGGALDDTLPCDDQIETAVAMCQRLTRTAPGPAPLVTDFVPCCSAAAKLNASSCLCDERALGADRSTFLRQLVGFAPLGCGFALTGTCPAVLEERFALPEAFTVEGVPEIRPVAGRIGNETAWRFLARPEEMETEIVRRVEDERLFAFVDGARGLFDLVTCDAYASLAPDACDAVRLDARVSTYDLTKCCAFLHAAHARGCLCPPAGLRRLAAINPDLEAIAPAACALRLDSPPPLGEATCKTRLTLEEVMAPANAIAVQEGEDFFSDYASAFFENRSVTLRSLADVAEEATPIVVTTPTIITLFKTSGGGDEVEGASAPVVTATDHEVPMGSVFAVVGRDAADDAEIRELSPEPFAILEPGATYRLPPDAVVASNITSRAAVEAGVSDAAARATAVTADESLVVTVADPDDATSLPWNATRAPAPVVYEAVYERRDDAETIPVAVVTDARDGVTTLVPIRVSLDDGKVDAATRDAVAAAEGEAIADEDDYAFGGGLIYAAEKDDAAGLGAVVPSSTSSCLFSVIIAEATCIPMLESVSEIFELDMGWRVCCARVAAANDVGCFCDGAVAAALETSSRAEIHERVLGAVPGACGFAVTTGDACPTARFQAVAFEGEEEDRAVVAVNVTTAGADSDDPAATLVSVDGDVFVDSPETRSAVTAAGAVVVSVVSSATREDIAPDPDREPIRDDADAPLVVTRLSPTLAARAVLTPQTRASATGVRDTFVRMDGDGVVAYESAALPNVTIRVDASGAEANGTTVVFANGTVSRFRAQRPEGDDASTAPAPSGAPADLASEAAVAVLPTGAIEASVGEDSTEIILGGGGGGGGGEDSVLDAVSAVETALGLEATYDPDARIVTMILPDGAAVSADAGELEASFGGADSDSSASGDAGDSLALSPSSLSAVSVDPDDPSRPLSGYGVVVVDGEVVPASGVDEDGVGEGVCDPVRKLKNFLTASLDPGGAMESFVVVGAVSHCWGSDVVLPELIVPIKYRPRGGAGGFAPPLTSPEAECLGLALVDLEGRVVRDDLCDRFEWTPRAYGADVKIANLTVCVDCALTGRASDGALFRLSHPASDTLAAMAPTVASLECDAGRHRPSADVASRRRGLLQFLANAYSNPMEVSDFFNRLAPGGGSEEDRGIKYGLVGDAPGGPVDAPEAVFEPPAATDFDSPYSDSDSDSASAVSAPAAPPRCEDDVARLANDVQWWSRGVGPLAPGLPNDPYDAYVFAGSLDVLSSGASEPDAAPAALAGIVLPIVFSPWVLDADSRGDWRAVRDPAAEIAVECSGAKTIRPDGTELDRSADGPCGGVSFALSAYDPPGTPGADAVGSGQETSLVPAASPPEVILLEVTFAGELCDGCRLAGAGAMGELFRVAHVDGASLDFVGPTVGALECALGGVAGEPVAASERARDATPPPTEVPVPGGAGEGRPSSEVAFVVSGEDRDVASCAGRPGLNLKGELLNDGGSLIKAKAEDCCADCRDDPRCNVWVYCEGDCVNYAYHSCWLKRAPVGSFGAPDAWAASEDTPWTSGWFPPKEGVRPPEPRGAEPEPEPEPEPDAEAEAEAPTADDGADPATAPRIRVVPVGGDAPPASRAVEADPATPADPGPGGVSPPEPDASGTPSADADAATFTLVPGEPVTIPASEITIIPGAGDSARLVVEPEEPGTGGSDSEGGADPATTAEGREEEDSFTVDVGTRPVLPRPEPGSSAACVASAYPACPSAAADPLASANVRGSFQLLRAREAETGGEDRASLTLLRPGDEAREIFVTGTLINAGDAAACLRDVEIPFEFPYAVALAPGAPPRRVPPSDFVASCYYVGVRSREASAAPGTRAANENAFEDAVAGAERPRACEDVVDLRVEDAGPVMAFGDDVALCPGCWLVGGRDGVLFSWKHKDGLAMTVRAGDDVGAAAPRCAAAEDAGAAGP